MITRMKDLFKTLFSYIKRHFAIIIGFTIIAATFTTVFYLYSIELEPVLYSVLISIVFLAVLGAARFSAFYKKHRLLTEIKSSIDIIVNELPEPSSIIESDYIELIEILNRCKSEIASSAELQYSKLLDYYTLWAHQIKTPIAAMRLLLQSSDDVNNDELSDQLFKIEQYVEMVLQYLRSDSISSDMVLRQYSLDDMVRQCVKKFRKQFLRKKISINVEQLNCTVLTDEKWLSFVIEQVISNSLKYTQTGGISIYMDNNSPKTLVIEDTGIGIRAEDLPRVCEKGFTGFNGRADKKSTGIGLFLCEKVLKKLSHTITVESELDKGTKVKIGLQSKKIEIE